MYTSIAAHMIVVVVVIIIIGSTSNTIQFIQLMMIDRCFKCIISSLILTNDTMSSSSSLRCNDVIEGGNVDNFNEIHAAYNHLMQIQVTYVDTGVDVLCSRLGCSSVYVLCNRDCSTIVCL